MNIGNLGSGAGLATVPIALEFPGPFAGCEV